MFTTNHYSEQDVTDAMGQMEQRLVTFFVLLQFHTNISDINHNLQDVEF